MDVLQRLFSKPNKTTGGSTVEKYIPKDTPPQLGFSDASKDWQEFRENHNRKFFGNSDKNFVWHEVVPIIPHVDIHVFPPSRELGRDFYTLITSGMSDEKMVLPKGIDEKFARAEIIFYVATDQTKNYQIEKPWYVQAMSFYAHFPFDYKTWLAFSHTLPNGNPPAPVVSGSSLTTALFLPPIFEKKEFIEEFKLGTENVNLLWLTYLTDNETEFKLKYGYDKLVAKFNRNNFSQVFDPARSPVV